MFVLNLVMAGCRDGSDVSAKNRHGVIAKQGVGTRVMSVLKIDMTQHSRGSDPP